MGTIDKKKTVARYRVTGSKTPEIEIYTRGSKDYFVTKGGKLWAFTSKEKAESFCIRMGWIPEKMPVTQVRVKLPKPDESTTFLDKGKEQARIYRRGRSWFVSVNGNTLKTGASREEVTLWAECKGLIDKGTYETLYKKRHTIRGCEIR